MEHATPFSPDIVVLHVEMGNGSVCPPPLRETEIHVWQRNLSCNGGQLGALRSVLSPDECERANRFRFDLDRNEFIVARGTLRILLGAYLSVPPSAVQFTYSKYGRPAIATDILAEPFDFNISHSGGRALFAFTPRPAIGIDIEKVRCDFDTSEIAERFFSAAERASLNQLPLEQRHESFFRCWTRKEAFIKALGEGLSHPLNHFDVSLAPGRPPAILATRPVAEEAANWRLWDLAVPSGFAGALAIRRIFVTGENQL